MRDVVADRVRAAIDALGLPAGPPRPAAAPARHRELDDRVRPARRLQPVLLGDLSRPRGRRLGHGYVVVAGSSDGTRERGEAILKRLIGGRVDGLVVVPAGDDHTLLAEEVGTRHTGRAARPRGRRRDRCRPRPLRPPRRGPPGRATPHRPRPSRHRLSSATCRRSSRPASATTATSTRCGRHASGRRPEWTVHGLDTDRCRGRPCARLFADGVEPRRARCSPLRTSSRSVPYTPSTSSGLHGVVAARRLRRRRHGRRRRAGAHRRTAASRLELGRLAGELLLDRIGGHRGPARHVILRNELIARGSGRDPAGAAQP